MPALFIRAWCSYVSYVVLLWALIILTGGRACCQLVPCTQNQPGHPVQYSSEKYLRYQIRQHLTGGALACEALTSLPVERRSQQKWQVEAMCRQPSTAPVAPQPVGGNNV